MKTDMITARIDRETKAEFIHICEDIGLSPSQAIKLFAKAVINYGGIPFDLKRKEPNKVTIQAMHELSQGDCAVAENTSALFEKLARDFSDQ